MNNSRDDFSYKQQKTERTKASVTTVCRAEKTKPMSEAEEEEPRRQLRTETRQWLAGDAAGTMTRETAMAASNGLHQRLEAELRRRLTMGRTGG
jgi:hypothetical protein